MVEETAIKPEVLDKLKQQLGANYVEHLPPLLGNDLPNKKAIKQVARAFSAFVLSRKFDISEKEASKYVIDDYEDNGVDAFYFSEANSTLYILQSKLKSESVKRAEVLVFTEGVKLLLLKDFDSFNENFKALEPEFEDYLDRCDDIVLALAYVGENISGAALETLNREIINLQAEDDRLCGAFERFDGPQVEKYLTDEFSAAKVSERIVVYNYSKLNETGDITLGTMKVSDLVALHNRHGNALYDKNIRFFIGAGKKGVNTSIKETLSSEPENFIYLNNGVTAICDSVNHASNVRNTRGVLKISR